MFDWWIEFVQNRSPINFNQTIVIYIEEIIILQKEIYESSTQTSPDELNLCNRNRYVWIWNIFFDMTRENIISVL